MAGAFEFPYEELINKPKKGTRWPTFDFNDHLIFGYFFKNIAMILFEEAGYEVYPLGYETIIPSLKRRLYESMPDETRDKVRTIPDLIVKDPDTGNLTLVEVKSRSRQTVEIEEEPLSTFDMTNVSLYKKMWPESLVVLFYPEGNYIYGKWASDLEDANALLLVTWKNVEVFFPKLAQMGEAFRRKMAKKIAVLFQARLEGQI